MSNRCFQGYMQKGRESFTGSGKEHHINYISVIIHSKKSYKFEKSWFEVTFLNIVFFLQK